MNQIKRIDGSLICKGKGSIKELAEKNKTNLVSAYLEGVKFFGTNLSGANLTVADLTMADLAGADEVGYGYEIASDQVICDSCSGEDNEDE